MEDFGHLFMIVAIIIISFLTGFMAGMTKIKPHSEPISITMSDKEPSFLIINVNKDDPCIYFPALTSVSGPIIKMEE